jgi:hypothetical protein
VDPLPLSTGDIPLVKSKQSRRENDREYFDSLKQQQEEASRPENPFDMDERLALGNLMLMQDDDDRNEADESDEPVYCTRERHNIN